MAFLDQSSPKIGPSATVVLPPRRKRDPRKLDYLKCAFCRKAKVKCVPTHGPGAYGKCRRCLEKSLDCSALQRKPSLYADSAQSLQPTPAPDYADNDSKTHDALVLLSLHSVMCMAVEELKVLGEELLLPFKHDSLAWAAHAEILAYYIDPYIAFLGPLHDRAKNLSSTVAEIVSSASLDLANTAQGQMDVNSSKQNTDMIARYLEGGHYGVAYVLQMKRVISCSASNDDAEVLRLVRCRRQFQSTIKNVLDRLELSRTLDDWGRWVGVDLTCNQLFTPRALACNPIVMEELRRDGRRDFLGRSVDCVAHDSGARNIAWPEEELDVGDVLQRSPARLGTIRADYELFGRTTSKGDVLGGTCMGLTILHKAAMRGHIHIFESARHDEVQFYDHLNERSSLTKRTCLHWAALCGQSEMVEYLCEGRTAALANDCHSRDYKEDTPLHLAARFGHDRVVQSLLKYVNWVELGISPVKHTPFWVAVTGRQLSVMKILEPFSNVDEYDCGGFTPLAEAARIGFRAGIEYLLGLNHPDLKRVELDSTSTHWNPTLKNFTFKTPLDLATEGGHLDCIEILQQHGAITLE